MELSNKQIEILQKIHDSDNHCLNSKDLEILKIDFPKLEDELQMFIEKDFIEYELRENKYYLAYEGFEILENKDPLKKVLGKNSTESHKYEGPTKPAKDSEKFEKITLIGILIATIFGLAIIYFNKEIENSFNKESIDQIDKEIIDSLQNLKNLED